MTTITFDGVSKVYRDGTPAVQDLDLIVEDGELLVLLGASGSGELGATKSCAAAVTVSSSRARRAFILSPGPDWGNKGSLGEWYSHVHGPFPQGRGLLVRGNQASGNGDFRHPVLDLLIGKQLVDDAEVPRSEPPFAGG